MWEDDSKEVLLRELLTISKPEHLHMMIEWFKPRLGWA